MPLRTIVFRKDARRAQRREFGYANRDVEIEIPICPKYVELGIVARFLDRVYPGLGLGIVGDSSSSGEYLVGVRERVRRAKDPVLVDLPDGDVLVAGNDTPVDADTAMKIRRYEIGVAEVNRAAVEALVNDAFKGRDPFGEC